MKTLSDGKKWDLPQESGHGEPISVRGTAERNKSGRATTVNTASKFKGKGGEVNRPWETMLKGEMSRG